jgi:hypothetical protein
LKVPLKEDCFESVEMLEKDATAVNQNFIKSCMEYWKKWQCYGMFL